jgi:hypothetical protein
MKVLASTLSDLYPLLPTSIKKRNVLLGGATATIAYLSLSLFHALSIRIKESRLKSLENKFKEDPSSDNYVHLVNATSGKLKGGVWELFFPFISADLKRYRDHVQETSLELKKTWLCETFLKELLEMKLVLMSGRFDCGEKKEYLKSDNVQLFLKYIDNLDKDDKGISNTLISDILPIILSFESYSCALGKIQASLDEASRDNFLKQKITSIQVGKGDALMSSKDLVLIEGVGLSDKIAAVFWMSISLGVFSNRAKVLSCADNQASSSLGAELFLLTSRLTEEEYIEVLVEGCIQKKSLRQLIAIDSDYNSVCSMLQKLISLYNKDSNSEEFDKLLNLYIDCVNTLQGECRVLISPKGAKNSEGLFLDEVFEDLQDEGTRNSMALTLFMPALESTSYDAFSFERHNLALSIEDRNSEKGITLLQRGDVLDLLREKD